MAITAHVSVSDGRPLITLTMADGAIFPTRYDQASSALITCDRTRRPVVALGPNGRAKIETAIAAARPEVWEEAIGDAAQGDGWEFAGVRNDVLGVYRRVVSQAVSRTVVLA